MSAPGSTSKPELTSWQEIADHLGVNFRTAQKWEKTRGLPVRRMPGQRGRVFASPDELDKWKASVGERPRWWNSIAFLRWYGAVATLIALALAAWMIVEQPARPGQPAQFRAEFQTLTVMDDAHRELWRHTFGGPLEPHAYEGGLGPLRTAFADVDGDSHIEMLFSYYSNKYETEGVPLYCFSDTGRIKWKYIPGRTISDSRRAYAGPHIVTSLAVADLGGSVGRVIALANRDAVYYPSQFVILDGRGKPNGEYWHSGHLDNMAFADLDGDGIKEILLSGVNNGYAAAALAVLDARDFTGASFQGQGSDHQILGLPLHKERALVLFPRSCMNRKLGSYNMAHEIFASDGQIRVHVQEANETGGPGEFIIYTLDRQLNCIHAEVSDSFAGSHRRLHALGILDHSLTDEEVQGLCRGVRRIGAAQQAGAPANFRNPVLRLNGAGRPRFRSRSNPRRACVTTGRPRHSATCC
jgi:hypothetical protein